MMTSTASSPLNSADCTPVTMPLCQKPPSPMIAIARLRIAGETPERLERRERVAADVGRDVHGADRLPRELHRREHRSLGAADAELRRARGQRGGERLGDGVAALAQVVEPRAARVE